MKRTTVFALLTVLIGLMISGCGSGQNKLNTAQENEDFGQNVINEDDENEISEDNEKDTADKSAIDIVGQEVESQETAPSLFLGKYDSFDAWRDRHMGSVGNIADKTILVSVYLDEPDYHWDEESMAVTKNVMKIAYDFLTDTVKNDYQVTMDLLYDVDLYEDLFYQIQIDENIPVYVTTEDERKMDDLEDAWIATLPVRELMEKYEADSIGFLFFVAHEGCSYSSMHFIDDGIATWDESCLLYLKDMYSKTLEYETPAVYAHELLHLYGAEDLYTDADVFSKDVYKEVQNKFSEDLMIKTYDTIQGKYTIYSDQVKQKLTPITAYLVGIPGVEYPLENEELKKEETSCFSGSTYDRPF